MYRTLNTVDPYRTNAKVEEKSMFAPSILRMWLRGIYCLLVGAIVIYLSCYIPNKLGELILTYVFHFDYVKFYQQPNYNGIQSISTWATGAVTLFAIPLSYFVPKMIGESYYKSNRNE